MVASGANPAIVPTSTVGCGARVAVAVTTAVSTTVAAPVVACTNAVAVSIAVGNANGAKPSRSA